MILSSLIAILVNVVYVPGPNAMPMPQAQSALRDVTQKFKQQLNLDVTFRVLVGPRAPERLLQLANRDRVLSWAISRRSSIVQRGLALFVLPPLRAGRQLFTAGYSSGICRPYGTSYVSITSHNQLGQDRYWHGVFSMLHELGHLLGASHVASRTIMNSGALAFVNGNNLGFEEVSKWEIRKCNM